MASPPAALVLLAPSVRAALTCALATSAGREPCGYLLGRRPRDGRVEVAAAPRGRNVHPEPGRAWRLGTGEQLRVVREARRHGLRVIGYWHGHLVGRPAPGRADHAGRGVPGPDLHLLVGRGPEGDAGVRAWRATSAGFVELPISAADSLGGPVLDDVLLEHTGLHDVDAHLGLPARCAAESL